MASTDTARLRVRLPQLRVVWIAVSLSLGTLAGSAGDAVGDEPTVRPPAVTDGEQPTASLGALDSATSEGRFEDAVAIAEQLTAAGTVPPGRFAMSLGRLARSLSKSGDVDRADPIYEQCLRMLEPAGGDVTSDQINLIRIAAASNGIRCGRPTEALDRIRSMLQAASEFEAESEVRDSHRTIAASICLQIGSAGLNSGQYAVAAEAYDLALTHGGDSSRSAAMLGSAWAVGMVGDEPVVAARRLAEFVESYPEHADAPRAARASAACLSDAGRSSDADKVLADLLRRWPTSPSAIGVVRNQPEAKPDLSNIAAPVIDWLLSEAATDSFDQLDLKSIRLGLLCATQQGAGEVWERYARRLATVDSEGNATAATLETLQSADRQADAERLAAMLLAPTEDITPTAEARQAACQWAGRTDRWSMIAMAAESDSPTREDPTRTATTERLFAEALTQTGRRQQARLWWNYLVDVREADDFPTVLRCAELETAVGDDVSAADRRVAAARTAAGDDPSRRSLVQLLEAEVAIRRVRFERARAVLERVLSSDRSAAAVRARAQWLIGETFFLQQDYVQAIDAYRRVEAIEPAGIWVAVSLIQAGKSFEQLGRTRDAVVCYGALVNQFADSHHAGLARQRLAALGHDGRSPDPATRGPSDKTLRR